MRFQLLRHGFSAHFAGYAAFGIAGTMPNTGLCRMKRPTPSLSGLPRFAIRHSPESSSATLRAKEKIWSTDSLSFHMPTIGFGKDRWQAT
jgi:hypothetical protein